MLAVALVLPDGRVVLPGNRWDLVATHPRRRPQVSVVIPYYDQQTSLELILSALSAQSYPADLTEVVVADDGSPGGPPRVRNGLPFPVVTVRQDDRGFRAAAARNLAASVATGQILCFLDADTIPEPGYLEHATRLPAVAPDVLVVGRRRHGDFAGWTAADAAGWAAGERDGPPELTEPQWLLDAYAGSRDLLDADDRSYRHVISAVLTCDRDLFEEVGGFDETFVGYGGEDWELAHRAVQGGAVLAHQARAVAWHDGADWAERDLDDRVEAKNAELLALAELVPDPAARRAGPTYRVPETVATVRTDRHTPGSLAITVASLLDAADCRVALVGDRAEQLRSVVAASDERVTVGPPSPDLTRRCRYLLELDGQVEFTRPGLDGIRQRLGSDIGVVAVVLADGTLRVTTSRAAHRAERWTTALGVPPDVLVRDLFGATSARPDELGLSELPARPRLTW